MTLLQWPSSSDGALVIGLGGIVESAVNGWSRLEPPWAVDGGCLGDVAEDLGQVEPPESIGHQYRVGDACGKHI